MAEIMGLALSTLKSNKSFQFHTEWRDLIVKCGAENLLIKKQFEEVYLPAYADVDEAIRKVNGSSLTAKINDVAAKRGNICVGMVELTRVMKRHYSIDVVDAAERLLVIFKGHGNIPKNPLNDQTSLVYNLLQELEGGFVDDMKAVGIDGWAAHLKTLNAKFDALIKQRDDERALKTDIVLKDARRKLDEAYKMLCLLITAFSITEDSQIFADFIKRLNVVIVRYGTRNTKPSQNNDDKAETVTPPSDNPAEGTTGNTPVEEPEKYPTARLWTKMVDVDEFKKGDICYIVVDNVKLYYEMIEESHFDLVPNGDEGHLGWKPLQ